MNEQPEAPWLDLGEAEVDCGLLHLVGNRAAFEQLRRSIDLVLDSSGVIAIGNSSMSIASVELVEGAREPEVPRKTWRDGVLTFGCLALVISFILSALYGFYQIFASIFK